MHYQYRHSADFACAPPRVFDALTDVARRSVWVPNLLKVQRLDQRPFGPGCTWEETFRTRGNEEAVDKTVCLEAVVVERPLRYTVRQLSAPGTDTPSATRWAFQLEPLSSGTRLHVLLELDYGGRGLLGLVMKLLAKGTGPVLARLLRDELQALQALLDVPT